MPTRTLDVHEIRRENLERLLQEHGAKTQLAIRMGTTQAHITHLLKPPGSRSARLIKEETARQIEEIMGLSQGRLDQADMLVHHPDGSKTVLEIKQYQADAPVAREQVNQYAQAAEAIRSAQVAEEQRPAPPPGVAERRAHPPMNPALMEEAIKAVIVCAAETHSRLVAEKAAGVTRLVYEHALERGRIDQNFVLQLVKLMR